MMKDNFKYDPEDIESLLMHKQFHELYEEERQFVLQHVGDEEEYESLRKTLFELHDAAQAGEWLDPDPELKKELLSQFAVERKGRFQIWLNSLFASPDISWYRKPALGLALATACIAGLVIFVMNNKEDVEEVASVTTTNESPLIPTENDSIIEGERLFAENLNSESFPPAPKPIEVFVENESTSSYPEEASQPEVPMENSKMIADAPVPVATSEDLSNDDQVGRIEQLSSAGNVKEVNSSREASSLKKTEKDVTVTEEEVKNVSATENVVTLSSVQIQDANVSMSSGSATYFNTTTDGLGTTVYNWTPPPPVSSIAVSAVKDVLDVLYTAR